MLINDAAEATGVSVETLRRWELTGEMPFQVRRTALGWRVYDHDEVERIKKFAVERAASRKRQPTT